MMMADNPEFAVWMMLAGLAAATVLYGSSLEKHRMGAKAAGLALVLGSVFALVCAKVCFLLHDLGANLFEGYFDEALSFDPATLSFVGGCLGFVAGTALSARVCRIPVGKALDLFAAPGCVFLFFARIAEAGMDAIGLGNEVAAEWLKFFPMALRNGWGDYYLSVFFLEAVAALLCLIPALKTRKEGEREGLVFARTAVCLLGAQICLEMLLQYPYIRTFITSFVSLEQVLCAVLLMVFVVRGCVRNRKWRPAAVTVLLLGVSAFFQFFRDSKIEFIFNEGWEWVQENADSIAIAAYILISAALIPTALAALRPSSRMKEKKI